MKLSNMRYFFASTLALYTLSSQAVTIKTDLTTPSINPNNLTTQSIVANQYLLGQGADPDLGTAASTCLVAPTVPETGTGTGGSVIAFGEYTQSSLETDFAKSSNFNAKYGKFSADGSSSFSSYSKDRQFSFVFRMKSEFFHESSLYRTSTLDQFAPVYRAMIDSGDYVGFRRSCGDRFIREIKRGGAFYATVRIDFASQEDYQIATSNGSVSFSIGDFSGGAGTSTTQSLKTKGVKGSFVVLGAQRGGMPEQLTQLFGGTNGKANITSCSFQGDTTACLNTLNDVIAYGNAFANQFSGPTPSYDVLEYVTQTYLQAYGIKQLLIHPDLTPDVQNMRNILDSSIDNTMEHYIMANNVYDLLNTRQNKSRAVKQQDYIQNVVEYDMSLISAAGRECWQNPTTCQRSFVPLFPSNGSLNPDGSYNPAPTLNPDGTPAPSDLLLLDPNRAIFPKVLPVQIFSMGTTDAYYSNGNGEYCKTFDLRTEDCRALHPGLIGALKCSLTGNLYPTFRINPNGSAYNIPVQADQDIVQTNMDQITDCRVATNTIYDESISHPYNCTVVTTPPNCRTIFGLKFCTPGTTQLNCPDISFSKNCATPNSANDVHNVVRCP